MEEAGYSYSKAEREREREREAGTLVTWIATRLSIGLGVEKTIVLVFFKKSETT